MSYENSGTLRTGRLSLEERKTQFSDWNAAELTNLEMEGGVVRLPRNISDSAIYRWTIDDGSGNTSSPTEGSATINHVSGSWTTDTFDAWDAARDYTGNGDYSETDENGVGGGLSQVTFTFACKSRSITGNRNIVLALWDNVSDNRGFQIREDSSRELNLSVSSDGVSFDQTTISDFWTKDGWEHYGIAFDAGDVTVFRGGRKVGSATLSESSIYSPPIPLAWARARNGGDWNYGNCAIGVTTIFSDALTEPEYEDVYVSDGGAV